MNARGARWLERLRLSQHTDAMTTVKGRRLAAAVVILIVGTGWFGVRERRCKVRGAAFARQVETIKRDAALELRVGKTRLRSLGFLQFTTSRLRC